MPKWVEFPSGLSSRVLQLPSVRVDFRVAWVSNGRLLSVEHQEPSISSTMWHGWMLSGWESSSLVTECQAGWVFESRVAENRIARVQSDKCRGRVTSGWEPSNLITKCQASRAIKYWATWVPSAKCWDRESSNLVIECWAGWVAEN